MWSPPLRPHLTLIPTSLVVQCLRLCAPNVGSLGLIPGQETRSHRPQLFGFPAGSDSKESACNVGHPGLISGSSRSPGKGTDNPYQNSCLENRMDRGAWRATVHGVTESDMTEQPNTHTTLKALSLNILTLGVRGLAYALYRGAQNSVHNNHRKYLRISVHFNADQL